MPPPATANATCTPDRWRASEIAIVAGLTAAALLLVLLRPDKAIDFRVYWLNARHYFRLGAAMYGPASGTAWPGGVYRYPPIFLDLFRPLALLPFSLALALWTVAQLLWAGWLAVRLRQRWHLDHLLRLWPALLLLAPYFIQEIRYGNAQFLIVALCLTSFLFLDEHPFSAGAALGFAAALKVWPLFFFPCLFMRRRWWPVVASALAAGSAATLLPILWRGPRHQFALLGQWLAQERSIAAVSARFGELWYPGQSLHDVLVRFLSVVDYAKLADARYPQVAWLHLAPATVEALWMACAAVLTAALLLALWRGRGDTQAAIALMWCGLVVLEPHVHRIILVNLFWPALWLAARRPNAGPRASQGSPWFWVATAAAVLEPLVPGGARQRALQAWGADFWLVVVPLTLAVILEYLSPSRAGGGAPA